jgi:pimeloyl-ACP methyl ester carboxylesterase
MPFVEKNGVTFHVQTLGDDGPLLTMIHGLVVGSIATWYFHAAPALARGHRVFLYDLRGHGRSSRPPSGYDLESQTRDLEALLDDYAAQPVRLVGHSFGALVALRFALAHPHRVARLALVEAPLPPSRLEELDAFLAHSPEELATALPTPLREVIASGRRPARRFLDQLRHLASESTLASDLRSERDIPDDVLARLSCPTLLVYGLSSSVRGVGERLAAAIPSARLALLPGGHFLPSETPVPLTRTLTEFFGG